MRSRTASRIASMLFFLTIALSGCSQTDEPPEVVFHAVPTEGPAPLEVIVAWTVSHHAAVTYTAYQGDTVVEEGQYELHGRSPPARGGMRLDFPEPTMTTVRLHVTDGVHKVERSVDVHVLGHDPFLAFHFDANVTTTCADCSDGVPVSGDPPGASLCQGWLAREPDMDCAWTALSADMEGRRFLSESAGGDSDLEFRTTCDVDPTASLGVQAGPGPEEGEVPGGARCAVLWETDTAPSTISFTVLAHPDPA